MRAVVFTGAGGAESTRIEQRPDPVPGADEVLVAVRFAGLSPADAHQREGRYPAVPGKPADIGGMEVAGVVESCGERVSRWRPGDRVLGFVAGGGLAERVVGHELLLAAMPETLTERDAASVPSSFLSAHDAILQAELGLGQTAVVHGAAGGFGTAAVQLARAAGARVLGVVRSDAAASATAELGGEPIADEGFADAVRERTGGRGADVIFEVVGAAHFPADIEAVATGGRIVVLGVGSGEQATIPLAQLMRKRALVRGTTLRNRSFAEQALAMRRLEAEVVPLLADGTVRAVVDSVHPVEQAAAAFDRLMGRGKVGNVIVDFAAGG